MTQYFLKPIFDCQFDLTLGAFLVKTNLVFDEQVVGLFGVSGSGKSSILHAVAGIHTPQMGHIIINNQVWFHQKDKINLSIQRRRVGLVFQDSQLFPHKSVMDNLLFGYRNITVKERKFEPDDIIALLKLGHLVHRMPAKLSGGEKQRVALGRAILYSPNLLLLDEPLSALDSTHKQEILPFLKDVIHHTNIPMLYVSHDMSEINQLTTAVYHL